MHHEQGPVVFICCMLRSKLADASLAWPGSIKLVGREVNQLLHHGAMGW